MSKLKCEPEGISQNKLQMACPVMTYFNYLIMQISLHVESKRRNLSNDAHNHVSLRVDSLSTKLKDNVLKEWGDYFVSPNKAAFHFMLYPHKISSVCNFKYKKGRTLWSHCFQYNS